MKGGGAPCRCCRFRADSLGAKAASILWKGCFKPIQAPTIRVSIRLGLGEGCHKMLGSPSQGLGYWNMMGGRSWKVL